MNRIFTLLLSLAAVGAAFGAETWKVVVDWDNQVFPSYIIATSAKEIADNLPANYWGDANGYVGVEYKSEAAGEEVTVNIVGSELIKGGMIAGTTEAAGKRYRIFPKIAYDYQKLGRLFEPTSEDVVVSLSVNGQVKGSKVKTVRFRSINDCPTALLNDKGGFTDYSWMFAAYVNENHPLIDRLLAAALKNGVVTRFKGYQGNSPTDVYEEVFAIWNTVQRTGVKYSSITTPSGESEKVFSQYVRKFEDCLSNSQANCVDGSALLASAFRKIGLHTGLVLVPGHCFVVVYLDDARKQPLAIETTVIGNVDLSKSSLDRGINSLLSGRTNNLSRSSFEQAVAIGGEGYNKSLAMFGRMPRYAIIDIERARKVGVVPLNSSR